MPQNREEKEQVVHHSSTPSIESGYAPGGYDSSRTKQLLRKMDRNVVPFLSLLYLWVSSSSLPLPPHLSDSICHVDLRVYSYADFCCRRYSQNSLSFLDRSNIGNARLANLEEDLKMTGLDYNVSENET